MRQVIRWLLAKQIWIFWFSAKLLIAYGGKVQGHAIFFRSICVFSFNWYLYFFPLFIRLKVITLWTRTWPICGRGFTDRASTGAAAWAKKLQYQFLKRMNSPVLTWRIEPDLKVLTLSEISLPQQVSHRFLTRSKNRFNEALAVE